MLYSYFNLTNKLNVIDRLLYDLIRFLDRLVVAYFFGPPYYRTFKHSTDNVINYVTDGIFNTN